MKNYDNTETMETVVDDTSEIRGDFLQIYTLILVFGTIFHLGRSFSFYNVCLHTSINMHDLMFRGISRAKMLFFNRNSSGRILNRFACDISNIDTLLPVVFHDIIDVSVSLAQKNLSVNSRKTIFYFIVQSRFRCIHRNYIDNKLLASISNSCYDDVTVFYAFILHQFGSLLKAHRGIE